MRSSWHSARSHLRASFVFLLQPAGHARRQRRAPRGVRDEGPQSPLLPRRPGGRRGRRAGPGPAGGDAGRRARDRRREAAPDHREPAADRDQGALRHAQRLREIASAIAKANQAGVPVIVVDTRVDKAAAASLKIASFVGSDNYEGGRVAGRYLAQATGGKAHVGDPRGHPGHETATRACAGSATPWGTRRA